jgi:hypothetical protein
MVAGVGTQAEMFQQRVNVDRLERRLAAREVKTFLVELLSDLCPCPSRLAQVDDAITQSVVLTQMLESVNPTPRLVLTDVSPNPVDRHGHEVLLIGYSRHDALDEMTDDRLPISRRGRRRLPQRRDVGSQRGDPFPLGCADLG